jgi:hypothetical protein
MSHLTDQVAALVDGQLSAAQMERAHVHLVRCEDCQLLVQAQRAAKACLVELSDPEPTPDFLGRLITMAPTPSARIDPGLGFGTWPADGKSSATGWRSHLNGQVPAFSWPTDRRASWVGSAQTAAFRVPAPGGPSGSARSRQVRIAVAVAAGALSVAGASLTWFAANGGGVQPAPQVGADVLVVDQVVVRESVKGAGPSPQGWSAPASASSP